MIQNQMSPPTQGQSPAPAAAFPTPDDLAQIEQDTGYPRQKIMQDIQKTGAQSKEELYPQLYQNQGIMPDAAQAAGGYEEQLPMNEAMPVQGEQPQGEPDGDEAPQRMAARAAMSGQPLPPGPGETTGPPEAEEESLLGLGASMRKPSDVHERARRLKARPY